MVNGQWLRVTRFMDQAFEQALSFSYVVPKAPLWGTLVLQNTSLQVRIVSILPRESFRLPVFADF